MVTRPLQIYGEMQHGIFSREKASWTAPRQQERESGGVAGLKMEQRRSFKFDESPGCFQNFENRLMCSTWAQSPRRQAEPRAGWGLVSRGHIFSTRATNYYRFFRFRNLFRSGLRRTLDTHTHRWCTVSLYARSKWIYIVGLWQRRCSGFPNGQWINNLSWMHCQPRSRRPACFALMWQIPPSASPVRFGITRWQRAL